MAIDVYLHIDGIRGESADDRHVGWIECTSVQFGVSAAGIVQPTVSREDAMAIGKKKFAEHLRRHAETSSKSKCATYVRQALEAGGAVTKGHPIDAKDYEQVLLRNGFHSIANDSAEAPYSPLKGGIAVIQPTAKGYKSGHIEGYDGKDWISDFV